MGSGCKLVFFNAAPGFIGSSALRQPAIAARVAIYFPSLGSRREGSVGLESRNTETSACHSEKFLFTVDEDKGPLSADSDAGNHLFLSLHSVLREESPSPSEEQDTNLEWPQLRANSESRVPGSHLRENGESTPDILNEETVELLDTGRVEKSRIYDNAAIEGDTPAGTGLRARKKARVMGLLLQGKNPMEILESLPGLSAVEFWTMVDHLAAEKRFGEALQVFAFWRGKENYTPRENYYATFIKMLGTANRPDISQLLFDEMKGLGLQPGLASYTALLDSFAEACCFDRAEELARKMFENGVRPNAGTFNGLMLAYSKQGKLDHMNRLFNNMKRWGCLPDYRTYRAMIVAYAKAGLFRRMERMWKEMDNNDWKLDSFIINAIIQGYAAHGLVNEMHDSYLRVKDYRILVSKATSRSMASVYIRNSKFYQMRLFVKDMDLLRKDVGNLLWNLLLLAFAANFQVKNMQRSFLGMEMAGFSCDLTTYNICALCYARMKMFLELHALLVRMRRAGIAPDMVTFGAVVDAYIFGNQQFQKMFKELDELGLKELCPNVNTDPLVFQAFGKGDFQSSSETLMQVNPKPYGKSWTYGLLLSFYLKKKGARKILHSSFGRQGSRFVAKKFQL